MGIIELLFLIGSFGWVFVIILYILNIRREVNKNYKILENGNCYDCRWSWGECLPRNIKAYENPENIKKWQGCPKCGAPFNKYVKKKVKNLRKKEKKRNVKEQKTILWLKDNIIEAFNNFEQEMKKFRGIAMMSDIGMFVPPLQEKFKMLEKIVAENLKRLLEQK